MEQYKQEFKMEAPLMPPPPQVSIDSIRRLEKLVAEQYTELQLLKRKIARLESVTDTLQNKLSNYQNNK